MNANVLAKQYGLLTPDERFRLIFAAGGRNDDAERERLIRESKRISLTVADYSPHAHAFGELSKFFYIELLDHASSYLESFVRADLVDFSKNRASGEPGDEANESEDEEEDCDPDAEDPPMTTAERWFRHALAAGFVLKTKVNGWKLFCERLNVPPFLLWQELPGFQRVQEALKLCEKAAFVEEGFVRWLNEVRPAGDPPLTSSPIRVERIADGCEKARRERTRWWGGTVSSE
jgi:hypothetical protein